ncbi:hypothetical protein LUZ61_013487 [Rhynchospora tenuis]|uniref:KIB1-4 beta-propeller domain-containing protein n=1 Tax=Rhynchospora tenuis TaxID=198213 RepID=A0AAD5Z0T7_9POAL|nr:hypothetical protein LUZ61_013487 [Rhynchospora tenuis]
MEAKEDLERDWSSLLPEVLNLISKKLGEVSDFVRFRAVCRAWCSSNTINDLPPQFPWILENRESPYESDPRFYSIPFGKIYTINASKSLGNMLLRPSDGYFKLYHGADEIAFLNPLNNHKISLPAYDFDYEYSYWIGPRKNQIGKLVVYVVCFGHAEFQTPKLVSCHLGQDKWCELNLDSDYLNCDLNSCYLFYHKHMLFNVERHTGVTKVTDIVTGNRAYVIPPIEGYLAKQVEFIVDASRDILRVFLHYNGLYYYWFDVYRLDLIGSSSPCWVKINSIGNQALFIDAYGCFALGASDFTGIKENCIYSFKRINRIWDGPFYVVEKIDIETGAREQLSCPLKEPALWFVPSLQRF